MPEQDPRWQSAQCHFRANARIDETYAAGLAAHARAELKRLLDEKAYVDAEIIAPAPAPPIRRTESILAVSTREGLTRPEHKENARVSA
jgi:hypothetical protein